MPNKIIDIIIYDRSVILTTGLETMISQGLSNSYRIISCNSHDKLQRLIQYASSQILIARPEILDEFKKNDYPKLLQLNLVYSYYDINTLLRHDGTIQISDSSFQILELLNSLKHDQTPMREVAINDDTLSTRELEVLKLLVSGLSTKELSEQLFISVHTVNNHRKKIIKKLGISTISGLTIYAVINDLIDPKQIMDSMK